MQTRPEWLKSYLDDSAFERVEAAIEKAETLTSGELVPIIVRRSSTVGHVPIILTFVLLLLQVVFDLPTYQLEWVHWPEGLLWLCNLLVTLLLVRLLSPLHFVERLFTSKMDQAEQVEARALLEFYEHELQDTKGRTGILIFVSIMEQRAVVLGDKAISEKLESSDWQKVVDRLIKGVRQKDLAFGFEEAIALSADLLKKHFPIQPNDKNEIHNHLIIKD
jgi:putative membrane protein